MGKAARNKIQRAQYEIGTMRDQLARDFMARVEGIINKHQKLDSYYILAHAELEAVHGIIQTKFLLFSNEPPKMLGTIVYWVNNKAGQLRRLWALPQDKPRDWAGEEDPMTYEDFKRNMDSDEDYITKYAPIIY